MLFRIAKIDREFDDTFRNYLQLRSRSSPVLSQIKSHVVHEGKENTIVRSETPAEQTEMFLASAETQTPLIEIDSVNLEYILRQLHNLGQQFEEQFSKRLFQTMQNVTAKTGQTVNAKGQPLNNEILFETLSKVQMDFEKSDTGNMSIVVPPGTEKTLQKLDDEIQRSPELRQKFADLMEQKRNEFREREINRSMVG
jgi:diadenosine tetraphosphate (Ap4A) HIT family hydrolase